MSTNKPHKRLTLWQKVMILVVRTYKETSAFPREEEYGLKSQMRRAVVSVPSNIAEGLSRRSIKEKLNFLSIARGSLTELDAQVEICGRLDFFTGDQVDVLENSIDEVGALLGGLIKSIRRRSL